jgi:hypothetical protein
LPPPLFTQFVHDALVKAEPQSQFVPLHRFLMAAICGSHITYSLMDTGTGRMGTQQPLAYLLSLPIIALLT